MEEGSFKCEEVMSGECPISCMFEDHRSGRKWMFTGVYNRDEGRVRGFLWKDLKDCKQKWDFP